MRLAILHSFQRVEVGDGGIDACFSVIENLLPPVLVSISYLG